MTLILLINDTDPIDKVFGQVQANGFGGVGAYAGVSLVAGIASTDGPITSETTTGIITEGNIGLGYSGGVSMTANGSIFNPCDWLNPINSAGTSVKPSIGVGIGAAAGVGGYTSTTFASKPIGEWF